jgi:hypothetical protein
MLDVKVLELCTMENSGFSRWFSRALGAPLIYVDLIAAVVAIIGFAVSWYFDIGGTVGLLFWLAPLAVLGTSVIVGFVYATISLLSGATNGVVEEKKAEPRVTSNIRPDIRFLGWETAEAQLTANEEGETQVGDSPWLTRLTFANEPDTSGSGPTAYKVSGHIEFYDAARDRFLFGMIGQWSDGDVGLAVAAGEKQVDIPPDGVPCYLNVALKYDEDDECYGINQDTAVRAPVDWRDQQRKLEHGLYTIKVLLHGENVAETFWFGLINRGIGQRVRILRISS